MQLITAERAFASLSGGTFVGMDTITDVKLTGGKKNPHQGRLKKRMTGAQVMCFSNSRSNAYEAMVHRRLEAEGKDPTTFEVGPRAWGERIPGTPFVVHNGKHYLEVIFLRSGNVEFLLDGHVISAAMIEGLPEKPEGGQGGLENTVVLRTFALDSITELRADGQTWK